jgi:hypothetical protein
METSWDDKVAQYLAGRSRVTIEQVCRGIGIEHPSSRDHGEIAKAMESAGWHHAADRYGCVSCWEPGPKSESASPKLGLLGIPEA